MFVILASLSMFSQNNSASNSADRLVPSAATGAKLAGVAIYRLVDHETGNEAKAGLEV